MSQAQDPSRHELDIAIGRRIRERRRALAMSQQALAEQVGVSFQQVQKYETGANRVGFSRLSQIAAALRTTVQALADGLVAGADAELERVNDLTAVEGATELLEAYAAIADKGLRRALRRHARALAEAGAARLQVPHERRGR